MPSETECRLCCDVIEGAGQSIDVRNSDNETEMLVLCDDCAESRIERCDCGERYVDTDGASVDSEDSCPRCQANAVTCDCCMEQTLDDCGDSHVTLCQSCRDEHYTTCDDCGDLVSTDADGRNAYGSLVCDHCAQNYFYCDCCGRTCNADDCASDGLCDRCSVTAIDRDCGAEITGKPCAATAGSARRFGVELEFSACASDDAEAICDETEWGAKPDGTRGVAQEFVSPPMSGDSGIQSVRQFCAIASGHTDVSSACGFHLHIDMTRAKELQIARVATAYQVTLPVWQSFVPSSRRTNYFCSHDHANGSADELAEGKAKPHKNYGQRYCAINWQSFKRHRTVEIRLHTGTCNPTKVCNWIRAHLAFVEHVQRMPLESILRYQGRSLDGLFALLCDAWRSDELAEYYRQRAEKFGNAIAAPLPQPQLTIDRRALADDVIGNVPGNGLTPRG